MMSTVVLSNFVLTLPGGIEETHGQHGPYKPMLTNNKGTEKFKVSY
jgi:hypothetical protein